MIARVRIACRRSRRELPGLALVVVMGGAACGPTSMPPMECGTEDIEASAALVIGVDGPSCDPCPAEADLIIATTLRTECGPVEVRTGSTCLVSAVTTTRVEDGKVYTVRGRLCGDTSMGWEVTPDEPFVAQEIRISEVFETSPIPTGTYGFEVELPADLSIAPATFEVAVE